MSERKSNVFFRWKPKNLIGLYGFANLFYVHVHANVCIIQDTGSHSIALQFQDYAVLQITTCLILKIVLTVSVLTFNRKLHKQGTLTFYKCMY